MTEQGQSGGYRSPYRDDAHIDGASELLRAVHPQDVHPGEDGTSLGLKSGAFQAMTAARAQDLGYKVPAMSVGLMSTLMLYADNSSDAIDLFLVRAGLGEFGVARLLASDVRSVVPPLGIMEDPLENQPWHALVFPLTSSKITGGAQKQMRAAAALIHPPTSLA